FEQAVDAETTSEAFHAANGFQDQDRGNNGQRNKDSKTCLKRVFHKRSFRIRIVILSLEFVMMKSWSHLIYFSLQMLHICVQKSLDQRVLFCFHLVRRADC